MDDELIQESNKLFKGSRTEESEALEEHKFIASCLRMGLSIQDLKEMQYKDVAKIMLCFIDKEDKTKRATQSDWDKLAGRR